MRWSAVVLPLLIAVGSPATAWCQEETPEDSRPTLAVMRFSNVSQSQWWLDNGERAARDVFAAHLGGLDGYRVVDRRDLDERMADEGILFRGEMSPATAIKIGRIFGIDYFVTGVLSEFGASNPGLVKRSVGRLPGLKTGQRVFAASVAVRLVDASTGSTLWADEARGEEVVSKLQAEALNDPAANHGRAFNRTVRPLFHDLASRMTSDREAVLLLRERVPEPDSESTSSDDDGR